MPAVYVALGWALGLFSSLFAEFIQKPYRRGLIRQSLFIELEDLRCKLGGSVYMILDHLGSVDRPFLEWLRPVLGTLKHRHSELSMGEQIQLNLSLTDGELLAARRPADPERALTLKRYTLPFLTSQIPSLSLFSPEFQRLALEIRAKLDMYNEDIDAIWFYSTKSFDSGLSPHNHQLLQNNMHGLLSVMAPTPVTLPTTSLTYSLEASEPSRSLHKNLYRLKCRANGTYLRCALPLSTVRPTHTAFIYRNADCLVLKYFPRLFSNHHDSKVRLDSTPRQQLPDKVPRLRLFGHKKEGSVCRVISTFR